MRTTLFTLAAPDYRYRGISQTRLRPALQGRGLRRHQRRQDGVRVAKTL
jgi:hypothetical protein